MVNKYIVISDDLRTMRIPSTIQILGVESDANVNRIHFQLPKEYCGYDLSTFQARINYVNANGESDIYISNDMVVDGDNLTFSWLVGRKACKYSGNTRFVVCLKKLDGHGQTIQEFNTRIYSLPVLKGISPNNIIADENPDIIDYILETIEDIKKRM